MKKAIPYILFLLALLLGCSSEFQPQDGDIIFQTSLSPQSLAIQKATHSPYSHVGIIYLNNGKQYVFEASVQVQITSLEDWIKRGKDGHYIIKRLRNADDLLDEDKIDQMKKLGNSLLGRPYDLKFEWTDDKLYCSELVWKLYNHVTGLQLGTLKTMADFDLSDPLVDSTIVARWNGHISMEEPVIAPSDIINSDLLVTVAEK